MSVPWYVDVLMRQQNLFSERRHYREYKIETTPDFSDVRSTQGTNLRLDRCVRRHHTAPSVRRFHTAHRASPRPPPRVFWLLSRALIASAMAHRPHRLSSRVPMTDGHLAF